MPILYLSWFVWHMCLYTLEKYEMSRLNTHTRKVEVEPLKDLIWRLHCFQICKKIRKGGCVFFQFVQTRVTGTCGRFYQERRFFSNLCENFALFLNKIAWVQDKRIVSKKIFGKLALPAETFWKAFLSAKAVQPILQKILNWLHTLNWIAWYFFLIFWIIFKAGRLYWREVSWPVKTPWV